MLQKCAYSIISHQELSGQQVAAYLKGYGDHYTSHKYRNLYWTAFEKSINIEAPSPECYVSRDGGIEDRDGPLSSEDVESEPDVAQPSVDGESDEICLMASVDHTGSDDDTGDEDVTIVAT